MDQSVYAAETTLGVGGFTVVADHSHMTLGTMLTAHRSVARAAVCCEGKHLFTERICGPVEDCPHSLCHLSEVCVYVCEVGERMAVSLKAPQEKG